MVMRGGGGGTANTQQQQEQGLGQAENTVDVEDISFLTRFMVKWRCT
jgi:hypothetical protein